MKGIIIGGSGTIGQAVVAESHDPIRSGSSASMVSGALDSFIAEYFRGFEPFPAVQVALAYSKSAEDAQTGRVYSVK